MASKKKNYKVSVSKTTTENAEIEVMAMDEEKAEKAALKLAKANEDVNWEEQADALEFLVNGTDEVE